MVAACPFPCPRGTPTRVFRMAEALGRRGHDVHVVTYHLGEEPGPMPFRIHRIQNVAGYRKLSPGPTWRKLLQVDVLLAAKLLRVITSQAIELIHAHHYEGLPVLYDAHTLLESELPSYRTGVPARLTRALGRWLDVSLPWRADEIVTVTEQIRAALLRGSRADAERITVVASGVEPERFEFGRRRPPENGGVRTLIFTGNLASYQGIEVLLRSFRLVLDHRRDVRLVIVTHSSFEPYEGLARELQVREFIDVVPATRDDVPAQLAAADVAVNPRVQCDGAPQKLLNYMAAGKPIVSFRGSGQILDHGQTGWLVEGHDAAAFALGTLRCLDDPDLARALGRAAHRAAADYRWDTAATLIEAVYDRLASSRPRVA